MAIDTRTIAELEVAASRTSTHAAPSCNRIVQMPFRMLLERKQITTATTVADLRRRYSQSCGGSQATSFAPWRHGRDTD